MSFRPINLDAFWKGSFSERYQLLNALIFIHERKTDIERAEKLAKNQQPITPVATPSKISNCNPPPLKRKTNPPSKEEDDDDYEVIIHKVTFDSDESDSEANFMIHKRKKTPSSIPTKDKK
jgi:primosomal protein N''